MNILFLNHFKIWLAIPYHWSQVSWQIKISQTSFEKGHQRNRSMKLFQILTSHFREEEFLRISSCSRCANSPHDQSYVSWQIKILRPVFEKGHPRNISLKLFPNLTSSFRKEDFFKNSSNTNSPSHHSHVSWRINILGLVSEMGHERHISVKSFQNLTSLSREKEFLRISSCTYCANSSAPTIKAMGEEFANTGSKDFQKRHSSFIVFQNVLVLLWFSPVHFLINSYWKSLKTEICSLRF